MAAFRARIRNFARVIHAWTFDEFYSAMAVQGLDTNGDGVFSAEELKPLAEVNIKSLKDFDYFTFVHIGDGDNLPLKPPENYSLDYNKGLLTLHLTLPLEKPLDAQSQEVQVDVYDPSFFVAWVHRLSHVHVRQGSNAEAARHHRTSPLLDDERKQVLASDP